MSTDVSELYVASIIRVEGEAKQETGMEQAAK
jgi:hypothetical protein